MKNWKEWLVCYAIKYKDGRIEEKRATVKGRYMVTAFGTALCDIIDPLLKQDNVADAVIWNIGIIDDDVFPEEGEKDDN